MFKMIISFFKDSDIRNKIFFTLMMLIIFRLGTYIPVPGVNQDALAAIGGGDYGIMNFFAGGALQNFSILALGVMPYITASIIIQLLQMDVVPKLAEWSKEGEVGRKKIAQVTRYATIGLAFVEGLGLAYGFDAMAGGALINGDQFGHYVLVALTLTAGTAFLMWLAEQITQYGVGNGMSVIIFAGIVATFPQYINNIYSSMIENAGDALAQNVVTLLAVAIVILIVIVGVILIQQANRKVPIQYTKKSVGANKTVGGQKSHLPIKINSAGVIPVIFAVSFLVTPATIASFFAGGEVADWIIEHFTYTDPFGFTLYVILIFAFSYFYAFVQVNPETIADNLQRQGGYIPGVRPGQATENYISKVLTRLTFVGAIFLTLIAILPMVFVGIFNLPSSVTIGGTSMLIVVGVALDTMKQLEGQLVKKHYKGFIK